MENIFVEFLPPWVETGIQPAFYDKESGTVLQQTARMYARVNMLIRMFNKLSKETKETVENYIEQFNQLHDYVHDYFDNLDVQEEINNKLDAMVEAGTLQEIIADYLNAKALFGFDTVADMVSSTNLIDGSYAQTLGFHSKNDGGGITYRIREYAVGESANGINKIAMDDNTLVAEAIIPNEVCPEMFGAYGDGTHNDHDALDYIFNLDNTIVCPTGKTYLSNSGITITKRKSINFGLSTIKFTNDGTGLTVNMIDESDYSHKRFSPVIENLILDGFENTKVMYILNAYKGVMQNIYVNNFKNIGIEKAGGYEMVLDNIYLWASNQNTTSIGLLVSSNDSEYGNIFGINCHTGVKITGGANHFKQIHMWLFNDTQGDGMLDGTSLYVGSSMIDVANNDRNFIDYAYVDSYHYGFKYSGYGIITLNSGFVLCADLSAMVTDFFTYPFYFIYAEGDQLKYLYRFSINNLVFNKSSNPSFVQKMIPDGYNRRPIRVNNSFIHADVNNLKTNFIDGFTLNHCESVDLVAEYAGNDLLHIHGMVKHDDTTSGFSIQPSTAFVGVYTPVVNNEIKICPTSSGRYFGTSTTYPLNIGSSAVGQLDAGVANNYYIVDYYMKIPYYN